MYLVSYVTINNKGEQSNIKNVLLKTSPMVWAQENNAFIVSVYIANAWEAEYFNDQAVTLEDLEN